MTDLSEYIKHTRHFDGLGMGDQDLELRAKKEATELGNQIIDLEEIIDQKTEYIKELEETLEEVLDWALANRDTAYEFVRCYTYRHGELPPVLKKIKALLEDK